MPSDLTLRMDGESHNACFGGSRPPIAITSCNNGSEHWPKTAALELPDAASANREGFAVNHKRVNDCTASRDCRYADGAAQTAKSPVA